MIKSIKFAVCVTVKSMGIMETMEIMHRSLIPLIPLNSICVSMELMEIMRRASTSEEIAMRKKQRDGLSILRINHYRPLDLNTPGHMGKIKGKYSICRLY